MVYGLSIEVIQVPFVEIIRMAIGFGIDLPKIFKAWVQDIKDFAEKYPKTYDTDKLISSSEIDDPELIELIEDTKKVNLEAFATLLGNNQFSWNVPILDHAQFPIIRLYYAMNIKNTKSMLNLYYFFSFYGIPNRIHS